METIAKYELREVLGQGGMGVVYRAYDPLMDREVALKIIQAKALDVPEMKARFVREARMAGKLSHDNIAVVYDLGEADGKTFIAMEYLPGRNLRAIIDAQDPLSPEEKLSYAAQICRGLHFAHLNGIIHRDIKPENIQVLPDHRIKIMDFGIAKPQPQGNVAAAAGSDVALTTAGMRIGTPWYMSPEQVKGLPIDRRSDIFSMGVLLYELFAYAKPFRGDDTTVLYKIVHEEPESLRLDDARLSSVLQKVLGKCLAKDPDARYDNCLEVLRNLEEATLRNTDSHASAVRTKEQLIGPSVLKMLPGNFVGETVSHFRILEKIGDGGMGTVYRAEDLTLKRTVALKFLLSEGTLNPRAKERFLMEARAASALDDPNICTIYEIGETGGGLFFICMAYCPGEDLGKILQKRALEPQEALAISIKVARGLSKAHQHGIVHRDIKPANVIVAPTGETKIVDFGLAKLSGGAQFTRIASVMGTLPYMSPEQIKGGEVDHRTDIWSLGIVLYQALTGRLPFEGAYEAALFYAIVNEAPTPPSTLKPSLPHSVDAIVGRALAKKVDDRYATMGEFLGDLQRARQEVCDIVQGEVGTFPEVNTLLENGKMYLERRRYADALSRFEAALKLSPGHPEAETLRVRTLQEQAQAEALAGLVREAEALASRGKARDARDILLSVTATDPQHQHAMDLLEQTQRNLEQEEQLEKLLLDAEFYIKRGKTPEARDCYRKVLAIRPGHRDALRGLKRTERKTGFPTDRGTWKTPLPAARRARNMYVPAAILFVVVAAALSWYLLQPKEMPTRPDTTTQSSLAQHEATEEKSPQTGMNTPPGGTNNPASETSAPAKPAELKGSDANGLVEKARRSMLAEKRQAERAGAKQAAADLYSAALRQEREAVRIAKVGTQEELSTAVSLYTGAGESYRSAADAAKLAALKKSNDVRTADKGNAQQTITSNEADKTGAGTRVAASGNPGNEASEKEPAAPPTNAGAQPSEKSEPPPEVKSPPTTEPAAKNEANAEATARNEIQELLQQYRESIEQGDTKTLSRILNLSGQALDNWSLFFSSSENRKVVIEGVRMDVQGTSARVAFKSRMSFFNNQTNTPQSNEHPRQWTLESISGVWKIVTQK